MGDVLDARLAFEFRRYDANLQRAARRNVERQQKDVKKRVPGTGFWLVPEMNKPDGAA